MWERCTHLHHQVKLVSISLKYILYIFIPAANKHLLLYALMKHSITTVPSKILGSQKLYFLCIIHSWEGKEIHFWRHRGAICWQAKEREGKGKAFFLLLLSFFKKGINTRFLTPVANQWSQPQRRQSACISKRHSLAFSEPLSTPSYLAPLTLYPEISEIRRSDWKFCLLQRTPSQIKL